MTLKIKCEYILFVRSHSQLLSKLFSTKHSTKVASWAIIRLKSRGRWVGDLCRT